jgi:hypothetical protein
MFHGTAQPAPGSANIPQAHIRPAGRMRKSNSGSQPAQEANMNRAAAQIVRIPRSNRQALPILLFPLLVFHCAGVPLQAAELPAFREQTVIKDLKLGYQIVPVDLNHDGKKDLIVIDERATELAWFQNPGWQRHVLMSDVARPINADCGDIDGDGIPEVAFAYQFETSPEKSIGNLVLLKHGPDLYQPWTAREIDRVPTAHRVRWIDPEGSGKKALVMAPLVGIKARPPLYDDNAPIYLYRPDNWERELLFGSLRGVLHAINPVKWDDSNRQQVLAASFEGLLRLDYRNGRWTPTEVAKGDPRPCPDCGSSEARVGRLGKIRFVTSIEPWHGNQVVVYLPLGRDWKRIVIEDGMINGHALAVGDLDGDGRDEIVAGFRGKGTKLLIFQAAGSGAERWQKTILDDGGIAAADCRIEDITNDGRPDVVCIGASTGNVRIFENLGRKH